MSEQKNNLNKKWKGLLLAGGTGSRLYPATVSTNKHLLCVYDKPLIYYSLSTLMIAGLRDIVVVSNADALVDIEGLLKDGSKWGISIKYCEQKEPKGIVDGINSAAAKLRDTNVLLTLGDNIFYGTGFSKILADVIKNNCGATIFGYQVKDPSAFGVIILDKKMKAESIVEKPRTSISNLAVPGLYFYDTSLFEKTSMVSPSDRGELEISDVNNLYIREKSLEVYRLGRGIAWLDAGTAKDLFDAAQYIKVIEDRTGTKVACVEEIAWRQSWINDKEFHSLTNHLPHGEYKDYLQSLKLNQKSLQY